MCKEKDPDVGDEKHLEPQHNPLASEPPTPWGPKDGSRSFGDKSTAPPGGGRVQGGKDVERARVLCNSVFSGFFSWEDTHS